MCAHSLAGLGRSILFVDSPRGVWARLLLIYDVYLCRCQVARKTVCVTHRNLNVDWIVYEAGPRTGKVTPNLISHHDSINLALSG